MTEHPLTLLSFVIANLAITLGYLYLAFAVLPRVRLRLRQTKIGGVGFFLLCGLTHTDMALQALFHPDMSLIHMATSWTALAIHIPQAITVWMFVTGLYIEVGKLGVVPSRNDPPPADPPT